MRKHMKKTVAALMVMGMTVSGAAGVYAGSNLQKITAHLDHGTTFQVNGAAFVPKDAKGGEIAPINYQNTEYLPVRALSEALKVSVTYNPQTHQVIIGSAETPVADLAAVTYSAEQIKQINGEFAKFEGFETAYAPTQMAAGDSLKTVAAGDDGVRFVFGHMAVSVSPKDYSFDYDGTSVKLANGATAKWYKPGDTEMLTFALDDRFVTLSSDDQSMSKTQLEKAAVSVAKLNK